MSPKSPTLGQCKLCHATGELRDSHFIPKAAYKIIKESEGESPIVVNAEVSLQSDSQMKDYVLCAQCEERFNKNGESWVMKYCSRNAEGFNLKELIERLKAFGRKWIEGLFGRVSLTYTTTCFCFKRLA